MISNDSELVIVREQIGRLERALESLAREVAPINERQFRVVSEGYFDQIDELRADVARYLGAQESASRPGVASPVRMPRQPIG